MRALNALIIEGSDSFRQIAGELLKTAGYSVTTAESGKEGLELAYKERFRMICCAYDLPDMAGSEFCGQIRTIAGYDLALVIILTLEDNPRVLKQALLAGATDIFCKKELDELEVYLKRLAEREMHQLSGRVLLIEDSRVLQVIIIDLITDMGLDVDAYTNADSAWEAFQVGNYDLVITDIMVEGTMSGISLVRKIRRLHDKHGNIPIIAASGFDNMSRKIELFRLGVNDYIAKPIVHEELRQRVFNHVTSYQRLLDLRSQRNSLYSLAMLDELTQLFNRHALREFSGKYFSRARRENEPLSLAVLDIDYFKEINEKLGFSEGDKVLAELGAWFKRFVREQDLVARWAGEEFVFILAGCDLETSVSLMERLQKRLKQFKPANTSLTLSIGIATMIPEDNYNLNSLHSAADRAMYQAKMSGRNCIRVHDAFETNEA
ncbi:diguanylate cyclase [Pseudomonadota bacterium]|nr:diguanylate cyclase [Pseudomonadota bacterium]